MREHRPKPTIKIQKQLHLSYNFSYLQRRYALNIFCEVIVFLTLVIFLRAVMPVVSIASHENDHPVLVSENFKRWTDRLRADDISSSDVFVIATVGKYREGKSTLLNLIARYLGVMVRFSQFYGILIVLCIKGSAMVYKALWVTAVGGFAKKNSFLPALSVRMELCCHIFFFLGAEQNRTFLEQLSNYYTI